MVDNIQDTSYQTSYDRIKGMIIGHALGDALGAPHEFKSNTTLKYTGKLEHLTMYYSYRLEAYKILDVGQVTDDTEMALTLLRTLIRDNMYIRDNAIISYITWANSGLWMLSKNMRSLFKGVNRPSGYKIRMSRMKAPSQNNGSLMRAYPMALINGSPWDCAISDCDITNPDDVNRDCAIIYVYILRCILSGCKYEEVEGLYEDIFPFIRTEKLREAYEQASNYNNGVRRDISSFKSHCTNAMYCVFVALNQKMRYTEAMKWIIEQRGDTDTNAAIVGAVLGALEGYEKLEEQQRYNISVLLSCKQRHTPRQQEYTLEDFDLLSYNAYMFYMNNCQ